MRKEKNFINGCGKPTIKVIDGELLIETIELPMPDKNGLIEDPTPQITETEFYNGEIDIDTEGYRITWEISYAAKTTKPTSLAIYRLLQYQKQKKKLILIPRSDSSRRGFVVLLVNTNLPFGILKGGTEARGNKGMVLRFKTKFLEPDIKWIDPNDNFSWTPEMNETNTIL